MSFTTEIKQEIGFNELKDCCAKAELSALVQLCSTLTISNRGMQLLIKTENATTAKRIWKMLKDRYQVQTELSVIRKMNLKKNNIYVIRVFEKSKEILEDLGIFNEKGFQSHPPMGMISKDCCSRAYLAGAFMAAGSCNAPNKSNYHLEISLNDEEHAKFIDKLMHKYYLPSKIVQRRKKWIIYLKAADKIADLLKCVGAHESLMKFESIRIDRDLLNSITRLDNCELANEMKSLKAANKQLEDIEIIEKSGKFEKQEPRIKEIITLRKAFPELSLNELSYEYEKRTGVSMSKSGMKHRFAKIHEIATNILEGR